MQRNKLLTLPFFIFFLSVFPALALLVNNLGQIALWVVLRPLIASFLIGFLLFLGALLLIKRRRKASLWTAWTLLLFFSYGHIYQSVKGFELYGNLLGRHRYLIVVWVLIFILGTWLILRKSQVSDQLILGLNTITLSLVLFQIVQIGIYQIRKGASQRLAQETLVDPFLHPGNPTDMPDVYLIILDTYGREDALNVYYHYDNHEFITQLENVGFYVADCAISNYSHTLLSLPSQLNLKYLDELLDDVNHESLSYLLKHNLVQKSFKEIGYTTYSFDISFNWAKLDQADVFYERPLTGKSINVLDPFEIMFIEGTLGRLYLDYYTSQNYKIYIRLWTPVEIKAQNTWMIFDNLRQIPAIEGPKFVIAHIMAFHRPFVFNADGSVNLQAEKLDDFERLPIQLDYLNPEILRVVEYIINNSHPDPIVILEGDHAFGDMTLNSILNAFYLPDDGKEWLYPNISLVNTFRVVFNQYFGTNLPLLEDLSYIRLRDDRYDYVHHDEWNPACIP